MYTELLFQNITEITMLFCNSWPSGQAARYMVAYYVGGVVRMREGRGHM